MLRTTIMTMMTNIVPLQEGFLKNLVCFGQLNGYVKTAGG